MIPLPNNMILRKDELIVPAHRWHLTPMEERIMWTFMAQRDLGIEISKDDLINMCCGDDPEGGPLSIAEILSVVICRMNKKLRPAGLEIVSPGHTRCTLRAIA